MILPLKVRIDPERTRAIRKFLRPRDVKGFSRFLGMIYFYHKFIPLLADRSETLNMLRRKGVKFVWGKQLLDAFEDLKRDIIQPQFSRWPTLNDSLLYTQVRETLL